MQEDRRDPFADLGDEPVEALQVVPQVLTQRPTQRRTPVRPSEIRRRSRKVTVTFSDASTVKRLRALAEQWGLTGPDGQRPNVSAVVEYLLLPQLERAEQGEIRAPGM
ncbi:MAG: hypothetical protein DRI79_12035 [Chloroflexi bacterium]|nr:MAG: hypothetical protein DRI79_12035 [Chloroflexota bacterium]HEY68824.1 hypothetical protein [Thermoflexia bacterium]